MYIHVYIYIYIYVYGGVLCFNQANHRNAKQDAARVNTITSFKSPPGWKHTHYVCCVGRNIVNTCCLVTAYNIETFVCAPGWEAPWQTYGGTLATVQIKTSLQTFPHHNTLPVRDPAPNNLEALEEGTRRYPCGGARGSAARCHTMCSVPYHTIPDQTIPDQTRPQSYIMVKTREGTVD